MDALTCPKTQESPPEPRRVIPAISGPPETCVSASYNPAIPEGVGVLHLCGTEPSSRPVPVFVLLVSLDLVLNRYFVCYRAEPG